MDFLSRTYPHTLTPEELFHLFKTSSSGLTEEEARRRLKEYGPNELVEEKPPSPLSILLSQFLNFLVILLLIAAFISFYLGETIEAIAIILIVIFAGLLGFLQEYQAERSLRALKKLITPTTKVLREGKEKEIPVREVVPGDIVLLESGAIVPADGRVIEALDFYVDEAILTGESHPIEKKNILLTEQDLPPYKQTNMVFMGTYVLKGKAKVLVTNTGKETEFGKIAALLKEVKTHKTPLQVKLERAGKKLGIFIVILSLIIGIIGVLKGHPPYEMFLLSVALAVAMIPEALPAVTTITLALGVKRLAEKKALIRRLPAVETLGSVTVICTDKTGTLTKNEMTVKRVFFNGKTFEVTGVGYEPRGEILINEGGLGPEEERFFKLLLLAGILCNDAKLIYSEEEKRWKILGDPTEGALIVLGKKVHFEPEELLREYPRLREIPFSSERMLMTTLHKKEDLWFVFTKGALEKVLEISSWIYLNGQIVELTHQIKENLLKRAQAFYEEGLRVLALAYKEEKREPEDPEKDLLFLGFVGMIDPPREEVKEAIQITLQAGIKPVMITGDHKITARAIGKEIGLYQGGLIFTGEELKRLPENELEELIERVEIFARALPEDKLKIIKAFQKKGHIVAMTGDGVNDAPALKQADIGIAMGKTGTEVAKEASSLVLLEESFATIVKAIEEGRTIFSNIRKFLTYLMTGNLATVLALTTAIFLDLPIPLTALQILFINLLMDGAPALALGLEPKEPELMKRPPRSPKEPILDRRSILFILSMGLFMSLLILFLYYYALSYGNSEKAGTLFFAGIITFRLVNALNCKSLTESLFKIGLFNNKWLLLALGSSFLLMLLVIYTPLSRIFELIPLEMGDWLFLIGGAFLVLLFDELRKSLKIY